MNSIVVALSIVCLCISGLQCVPDMRWNKHERRQAACSQLFGACNKSKQCCGDMKCHWENGYTAKKDGECVECIDRGQRCQDSSECCQPYLFCDRPAHLPDGVCESRKAAGEYCTAHSQCSSGTCLKSRGRFSGLCS